MKSRRMQSHSPAKRQIDPMVSRNELSGELRISRTTLWRWVRDGYLPRPLRLGKKTGWPRSVIENWKAEQRWPDAQRMVLPLPPGRYKET